jgi:hypothetical protein
MILAASLIIPFLLYAGYRLILPHPIRGIPFNQNAVSSIMGDMPELVDHIKRTGEMISWFSLQAEKLKSPIVQIFPTPFSRPWVC